MPSEKPTRASLEALMDQYLEALVAHEPARLPLSKKVKHTENTIRLPVGEGLWATASDLPTYRLYVCDPQGGQVGLYGYMKENGFPILIAARLKTEKGLITEIENIVVRQSERPFIEANLVKPRAVFLEALKPGKKSPAQKWCAFPTSILTVWNRTTAISSRSGTSATASRTACRPRIIPNSFPATRKGPRCPWTAADRLMPSLSPTSPR